MQGRRFFYYLMIGIIGVSLTCLVFSGRDAGWEDQGKPDQVVPIPELRRGGVGEPRWRGPLRVTLRYA